LDQVADNVTEVDLAVVGAGAAGIGAGLAARASGLSCRILEAGTRVGGRAHTASAAGIGYDLGCHFLHDASRNPFTLMAMQRGLRLNTAHNRSEYPQAYFHGVERRPEAERAAYAAYCRDSFAAIEGDTQDRAASDVIDTESPFYADFRSWCAAIYGAVPEKLSTRDAANGGDAPGDWPVLDGYGALIASLAEGLSVTLSCPVTKILRGDRQVRLETPEGMLTARAAILTVSTNVLKAGRIAIEPGLPDPVLNAAALLPAGTAERSCLVLDGPAGDGQPVSAQVRRPSGMLMGLFFNEGGAPTLGGYFAGDLAESLVRDGGAAALLAETEDAAADIFGAAIRKRIVGRLSSAWTVDPFIGGGYSLALPGHAAARDVLAEPFDERLRLAGEACDPSAYGTAHGAYRTGVRAVARLIEEGRFAGSCP
jgi:monoamine oxidase